ncbi:hypothetical protein, partial [Salmonella sp. SAL4446]|uniref:hypothetical protein n=1 Tax=Salmonella sp. SAL4446 TaxID=3159901 RepID=UPI00397B2713
PGIHTLWLLGCNSSSALRVWDSAQSPVSGYVLATHDSKLFQPMMFLFADELSCEPLKTYEDMISLLEEVAPEFAKVIL